MTARYTLDEVGFGEHVLCAPWMVENMRVRAERVAFAAEAMAPVDEEGPHPGRYKAAFSVESGVRTHETTRAFGRVTNDSPEARFVEYGTRNNPRYRTLGKALDAAGG